MIEFPVCIEPGELVQSRGGTINSLEALAKEGT
jgi:hypothetical protein